uniref:Uncharacterized protein n=1 Tax=Plectus sambesii TaxID=2011161 RepID=A0A914WID4_9BILA
MQINVGWHNFMQSSLFERETQMIDRDPTAWNSLPKQTPLCSLNSTCKLLSLRDRNLLQSKMQKVILCILLLTVLSIAVPSVSAACKKVGPDNVKIDRACSRGESLGCNAGGQGQNCRFCGKEGLPRC